MWEFCQEYLGWGTVAVALLGTLIEVSPIKFNPWSSILSWLGNKMNRNLAEKMDVIEKQGKENKDSIEVLKQEMGEKFKQAEYDADEKEARRLRAGIISFADSCRIGTKHTKTQFNNVFRDYDDYLGICERRELKNHFIDEEMAYVHEIYQSCLSENKFL